MNTKLNVTVSGSFRRSMPAISEAVERFNSMGHSVLSPADPRIVDAFGEFLYVASDRLRNIGLVQERHFAAIDESAFLWVVIEDGYIGLSTALEIGYAVRGNIPVLAAQPPTDLTLRAMVTVVRDERSAAIRAANGRSHGGPAKSILLDPDEVAERAHRNLDVLSRGLLLPKDPSRPIEAVRAAAAIADMVRRVR